MMEPQSVDTAFPPDLEAVLGPRLGGIADLVSSGASAVPDPAHLIQLAVAAVPNSAHACLTLVDLHEQLQTLASSDDVAATLDQVQLELRNGPSVDVVRGLDVVHVPDLVTGGNWPMFCARARASGVHSLLSVRLPVDSLGRASLTFYADRPRAFTDVDVELSAVCGSVIGLALRGARDRERATNLEIALASNRHIGTAIGVLMARSLLTADQAFDQLRDASQRLHRKLRDIADDVVNTGQLPTA